MNKKTKIKKKKDSFILFKIKKKKRQCVPMFIAGLFTIAELWKQPTCHY
jgi:hypothetical protein